MSKIHIEFKNVDIKLNQQENYLFKNLNIKLLDSNFYWLTGKIGTGKSTFLKAIYGDIPIQKGIIEVDSLDIKSNFHDKKHLLHRKTGNIFQEHRLLNNISAYKNLEFVLQSLEYEAKKIKQRINEVAIQTEIQDLLEIKVSHLSGGQKQKISMARALLLNPDIILADEACAFLDQESSSKIILNLFNQAKLGKTIVFATHQTKLMEKFPAKVLKTENYTVMEL